MLAGMKRLLSLAAFQIALALAAPRTVVYVGTYTGRTNATVVSEGIYAFELSASGELKPLGLAAPVANPAFLAIHPSGRYLYSVSEIGNFQGQRSGAVTAFAIDRATGKLTPLNQQPTQSPGPCHLNCDRTGRNLLVANYGGGAVTLLPVEADGKLGPPTAVIQHQGKSVNSTRQEAPHAHSVNISANNQFAVVADLGLDQVLVYRLDAASHTLKPHDPPFTKVAPGAGPRHFSFHPKRPWAYVINELSQTVTAFDWNESQGTLRETATVSTLPAGLTVPGNSTAEVVTHPNGKFLYGSNRGHDSLAVFTLDAKSGVPKLVENTPSGGKVPRNFAIDPSGRFLIAAHQNSDNLVVFRIDPRSGKLTPTGSTANVGAPVCVRYLTLP